MWLLLPNWWDISCSWSMLFSSSLESSASYSDCASLFLFPKSFSMFSYSWAAICKAWDLAERGDAFNWSWWPLSLMRLLKRLFTDMLWDLLSRPESSSRFPSSSLFGVAAFEFFKPIWISCIMRSPNSSSVLDYLLSCVLVWRSAALFFKLMPMSTCSWFWFALPEFKILLAIIFWLFSVFFLYLYARLLESFVLIFSGSGGLTAWPIINLSCMWSNWLSSTSCLINCWLNLFSSWN